MKISREAIRPSIKRHQLQRFWQILFPIALISLLVVLGGGYLVITGGSQTRIWSDIAIVWLIFPLFGILLVSLAIVVGLIFLMVKLNQKTRGYSERIQQLVKRILNYIVSLSDSVAKPVFWIHQTRSGITRLFKKFTRSR